MIPVDTFIDRQTISGGHVLTFRLVINRNRNLSETQSGLIVLLMVYTFAARWRQPLIQQLDEVT